MEGFLVKLGANLSVAVAIDIPSLDASAKQLTFIMKCILKHTHAVYPVRDNKLVRCHLCMFQWHLRKVTLYPIHGIEQ